MKTRKEYKKGIFMQPHVLGILYKKVYKNIVDKRRIIE
jgi:hypothetical protein